MKVLLTTNFELDPQVGGPAHTVVATGRKLAEEGLDIRYLTGNRDRFPPPGERVAFHELGRFDLVHNFGIWVPFSHGVAMTARAFRTPRVWAPIGALESWALSQKSWKKQLALSLYQRRDLETSAAVHATAASEAESLRKLGIKAPIAVIPHGMEVPAESQIEHIPSSPGDVRTLLFLSRIHPKKGLLELVEAWSKVRPSGWRVVVAGPDERGHRAEVEAAISRLRVSEDFSFVGQVTQAEKARLFRSADVFVLPTFSENFGLVVPEALSYGVPVLTTRGAPWSELEATHSGWWIETGTDALAGALEQILAMSEGRLRAMGRNGRRLVIERYGWTAVVKKHVELYRWIAGDLAKPAFVDA